MRHRAKPTAPTRPRVRRGNLEDAARLRAELIAAAMELYREGGLPAVSVRAVAARVGVSPMSTYRYFADKAELLGGLWGSVFDELCELATRAVEAAPGGARERHRAFVETILRYWEEHQDHFVLVHGFSSLGQDRQAKTELGSGSVYSTLRQMGVALSEAFAREIGADPARGRLASEVRLAMTLGYLHGTLVATRYPWSDRELLRATYLEQIEQAVERCLLGVTVQPAPPPPRQPAKLSASSRRAA
jgi:AcrR family transcriptional regulator